MHTRVPGGAPLIGVMLVASTGTTRAQDPVRVFDFQPTGSLVVRNQTLHLLIAMAYGMPFPVPLPEERIVGGPGSSPRRDSPWTRAAAPDGQAGASIFTAIKEQLGLELRGARVPLETVVVTHAERPTPD